MRTPPPTPRSVVNHLVVSQFNGNSKGTEFSVSQLIDSLITTPVYRSKSHQCDAHSDSCISPMVGTKLWECKEMQLSSLHWSDAPVVLCPNIRDSLSQVQNEYECPDTTGPFLNRTSADVESMDVYRVSSDDTVVGSSGSIETVNLSTEAATPLTSLRHIHTYSGGQFEYPSGSCGASFTKTDDSAEGIQVPCVFRGSQECLSPVIGDVTYCEFDPLIYFGADLDTPQCIEELIAPELAEAVADVHEFISLVATTLLLSAVLRFFPLPFFRLESDSVELELSSTQGSFCVNPETDVLVHKSEICSIYPENERYVEFRVVWKDLLVPMLLLASFVTLAANKVGMDEATAGPDLTTRVQSVRTLLQLQLTVAYALLVLMVLCAVLL